MLGDQVQEFVAATFADVEGSLIKYALSHIDDSQLRHITPAVTGHERKTLVSVAA